MTISPDRLKNFIDGRLAAEEASGIAARIENDPDLAAYVEDQKAVKAAGVSPAMLWLNSVRDQAAARSASWIPAFAVAAGIGLGVLLAASFGIGTDVRSDDGALIAEGELARILSTALADDGNPAPAAARVTASFWSKNDSFCRSFVTRGNAQSALAGVACRERGAWRIAATATIAPNVSVDRVTLPASIRNVMDNLIVGMPLDSDAERQLRNQGWRAR
jgi:hypothetical protein